MKRRGQRLAIPTCRKQTALIPNSLCRVFNRLYGGRIVFYAVYEGPLRFSPLSTPLIIVIMIIYLDKKEFSEAVARAARFAQKSSATLPVLSGIVLIAGDDGIKLRATNLETGIDLKVEGTIKEPGVVAVPAQVLREITSSFSGTGNVTIEHGGDIVTITAPTGKSTLKTLAYEDFPSLPLPESTKTSFSLPGAVLRALAGAVVSCASTSTVRPTLRAYSCRLRAEYSRLSPRIPSVWRREALSFRQRYALFHAYSCQELGGHHPDPS